MWGIKLFFLGIPFLIKPDCQLWQLKQCGGCQHNLPHPVQQEGEKIRWKNWVKIKTGGCFICYYHRAKTTTKNSKKKKKEKKEKKRKK